MWSKYRKKYAKSARKPYKKTLTAKVAKIQKTLRQRRPEKKHHDVAIDFSCTNNEALDPLCYVAEGDGSSNREGLRIQPLSLKGTYQLQWNNGATQETSARVMIILDKESDGAVPTRAQIFEGSGTANATALLNNINEGTRFVVLYDRLHNNYNATTAMIKEETYRINLKLNRKMHFRDAGVTANSLGNNMIYIVGLGDVADAAGTECEVDGALRMYYYDN